MLKLYLARFMYAVTKGLRKNAPSLVETVSLRSVFPQTDVQELFDATQSWDMVLAICGYASMHGHSDLMKARKFLIKENPGQSAQKLFQLYGII